VALTYVYLDQCYSPSRDVKIDSMVLLLSWECERSFGTGPMLSECSTAVASSYSGSVRHVSAFVLKTKKVRKGTLCNHR
jgi:hypothetical protein